MTVLFIEGFDWTTTSANILRKWGGQGVSGVNTVYSRFSGGNGVSYSSSVNYITKQVGTDQYTTLAMGVAIRRQEAGTPTYNATYPVVAIQDKNGTSQVKVHLVGSDIQVRKGDGTLLGTAAGVWSDLTYHYLILKVYVHATAGTVELWFDGIKELDLTSQDTKNGTDYADKIYIGGIYSSLTTYMDDVWVTDGDVLGDCQVKSYRPDSDETHNDFEPSIGSNNYAMVDETSVDDDSTYNDADQDGDKDSYGFTPSGPAQIVAVAVTNTVRKTGNTLARVKNLVRSGGSDYQSTAEKNLGSSYGVHHTIWEDDPGDSNPWTNTKIQAAEFGVEVTALTTTTTTTTTSTTTTT